MLNRVDDVLNAGREAVRIAKGTNSPYLSAYALSFLAFNLSWADRMEHYHFDEEALLIADQAFDYVKDEKFPTRILRGTLMVKCMFFNGRGNWKSLLKTGQHLCELAKSSQDNYSLAFAFLWIAIGLRESGCIEEAVTEAQNALEFLESTEEPQIGCEIGLHQLLIESLAALSRWEAIWQHARAVLAHPQDPTRYTVRFAVRGAVIFNARNKNDYRMAMQCFEESGGWDEILSLSASDFSTAKTVGLYLATATRLQDWARIGSQITAERWEWIDQSHAAVYVVETIAALCNDQGRALAFSALDDLLTNGLPLALRDALNRRASDCTDTRLPAMAFLEGCISSFVKEIDDAGFLTDVVDTIQDRFPDHFEGLRKMLTSAADFHRSRRDPAILARMDPDIAQALRAIWLYDTESE
jgi:hypothetical protein